MHASEPPQKVVFRPQARLLSLLGEQLISDQTVGLIELVKNAYDADATLVEIILEGLYSPESTHIVIRDNGFGMTRDDVEKKWLSPAINYKEKLKRSGQRTPLGRLPIGEKGVGRFAVQQLGHQFQLISRYKNSSEVVVEINWDDFDREDALLNDVGVILYERDPLVFTKDSTGTVLLIETARSQWNEQLVVKVQRALRRLQSPRQGANKIDFQINFSCPEFPAYQNISSSDIFDYAHYTFDGMVTDKGTLDYEYICRHPAVKERIFSKDDFNLIPLAKSELFSSGYSSSGPFYIKFYVWDRTPEYLNQSNVSRADLDAMAGVSIFRDGLRVLPYGEPGNDWLDLDKERINAPSTRIGNQQIIGFIEVFQQQTPELRDKTNREGLIDNAAFQDMRALVRASINVFLSLWREDRQRIEKHAKPIKAAPSKTSLDKAQKLASKLEESSRDDIVVKWVPDSSEHPTQPDTYAQTVIAHSPPVSTAKPIGYTIATDTDNTMQQSEVRTEIKPLAIELTQRQAMQQLLNHIKEAVSYQEKNEADVENQIQVLMHLAATGMAAERVAHEFGRQVGAAIDALRILGDSRKSSVAFDDAIRTLSTCLGTLRNEFKVLAPYEANWRAQRTVPVSFRDSVLLALELNKYLLTAHDISARIIGDDFEVKARPSSLVQVVDNLIHNACTWLDGWPGERLIEITLDSESYTATVSDTGPGVPEHMSENIFKPFVSLRNGGRGLGLYITRELLLAMQGSIKLATTEAGSGSHFLLQFPPQQSI